MIEHTERDDNYVHVLRAVAKDENVMKVGADIRKDETILKAGQLLTSREVGVLAALGISNIRVYTVPRVAVLSTGGEVIEPGKELPSGKIYNINTYSLSTAVLENGGKPLCLGVVSDDLNELQRALRYGLASADMILTSGGVSVGPKDIMPKALNSIGKPGVIICGIAIKPGKPTTVALIGRKVVFSLPGHPTSALLTFHLLARPIIQAIAGRKTGKSLELKALTSMRIPSTKGRRTFIMVRLKRDELRRLTAEPVLTGLSGAITTLARADGYVEISEKVQFIDAGETVCVRLFRDLGKV
jgi:putative molybdopterin biosynthesis protein